jgi:nucleoside-diphosphate-sugar epimerase
MRVFLTGATGWIGSAIVPELLQRGHEVTGLARSDEGAEALGRAGIEVLRGSLADLDTLHAGAEAADGVIHTAFIHDFSQMQMAGETDNRAVETLASALEGTGRPLVITTGTALVAPGRIATERDRPETSFHPRIRSEVIALSYGDRGVRVSIVRPAPSVHGKGDKGFVPILINIARDKGVSGYIGDGSNRWPAVHRLDAAQLYVLGLEFAPAGSVLHAIGEEGIPTREIAEVIGRKLDLPVASIDPEAAAEHFGWMGAFFGLDAPASSALTQELAGWRPTHVGLLEDLEQGHYFEPVPAAA